MFVSINGNPVVIASLPDEISADVAMTEVWGAESWDGLPDPLQIGVIIIKIKTHTPGAGTLLVTLRYNDGEADQDLSVSLALTAGNYAVATWPNVLRDPNTNVQMSFTFLSPGGTADVWAVIGRIY